ncbi:MAG: cobalamin-binding protein [Betaproteobacteria bacterium]|nr:cobalamin-binding protein [Betaproteobacteria bacterium]
MSYTPTNERQLIDALGTQHEVAASTARVVSLVPSITELLLDLGLGKQLVGRTGFCIHPRDAVKKVSKVGGTKSIDVAKIRRLAPTHLIANIDENPRSVVQELAKFVPHVVITHPIVPEDNLKLYRLLGGIFSREDEAQALAEKFRAALAEVRSASEAWGRQQVIYLIWKSPWMTVSRDTYISRMLAAVGWDTFEVRSDARYPTIELTAEQLRSVSFVLFSTEPYSFSERHLVDLLDTMPLGQKTRCALIDGSMTSWYGSRAVKGLAYLRDFRRGLL